MSSRLAGRPALPPSSRGPCVDVGDVGVLTAHADECCPRIRCGESVPAGPEGPCQENRLLASIPGSHPVFYAESWHLELRPRDTSGQGRFCTIFRSYSRGAQGVILVYDIANRWSFDGIDRWIKEIDEHAPGVPKILVGNRLHLAFKRQVPTEQAQAYAERLGVTFFEVSPLCNFNITESFTELARTVLLRHGMDRLWRPSKVLTLQDLCCRAVVSCTPVHLVDRLPLPMALRSHLKSFSMASGLNARMMHGRSYSLTSSSTHKRSSLRKVKAARPPQSPPKRCPRNSCKVS
ncbi:ras-related protein Rab-40B isoform X1 [Hyaena hyaena]|uniref:ras-related protein Rab-40B isoform X1 n=1 Tax=Hyaena hyaena TaxID=95912 RepID=UPI0019229346|nr:ras-related protein Rab-40B isoform X1 [Hyaena hyaena]